MNDYIEIPAILENVNEINSPNLKSFFESSAINERKISLDTLRETYKVDRNQFVRTVDELSLRGFRFFTEKPNNILPHSTPAITSYIVAQEDKQRFESVNLSSLGIAGLFQRFNVNSDLFFHKIPLSCFKLMNANIDLEEVEDEFSNAGFVIEDGENPQRNQTVEEPRQNETTLPDDGTSDTDSEDILRNIPIEQLFEDNRFKSFRKFCLAKRIKSVLDVSPEVLEQYSRTPSVGLGRVSAVEERLEEIKSLGENILLDDSPDPEEPVLQFENKYAGEMEISLLFQENGFTKFRMFCQEKGIKTVGQIKHKHIESFTNRHGIGKKKVDDVLEHLKIYANSAEDMVPSKFQSDGELFEYIDHWQVTSMLKLLGYQTVSNSSLKIADIKGENLDKLETEFDVRILIDLSKKLRSQKLPKTIANEIPRVLTEREFEEITHRFIEKMTLEEIGQIFGVTRERVRQIEIKAIRKLIQHLELNDFKFVVTLLTSSKTLITTKELLGLIGEENQYLIEVLKNNNSIYAYFEKLDVFCCNPEECSDFHEIEEFITDLPEQFYLYEFEALIEEMLEKAGLKDPSVETIHQVLKSYGLIQYGEFYSKSRLYLSDVLELLFRVYISAPLRIDENGIGKLQKLALDHLDYQLEGSVRSIDGRLRDTNNVLLVDRYTYQWFDSENFDQEIIKMVDQYLKKRFEAVNVINIDEVFIEFEEMLKPYKVTNKLHFYSIIKYFLDDEYSIGKGNTLNIYQNDQDKMNVRETLVEAIRSLGGTCTKSDLQELLRVPRYRIDLAISASKQLVPWGTNQVTLFDSIGLTKDNIVGLIALVNRSMKDGYTTIGLLYNEMMFDRSLSGLISKKGIDNKTKLAAVIKKIMPELKGHTNFFYKEGCPFTSFDDVILNHFNQGASRREVQDFAIEHGYGDIMAGHLINHLLEDEALIEVDFDLLYPAQSFDIPSEAVDKLISFIEEQMQGKEYISLNLLKGYRRKLPAIEFRWNPYLMRSILVRNGYRQISKIFRDYRYDKVVLVKEDSNIKTFEDLVYYILKQEYDGNMHEVKVYDFLVEKGILREQDYDHEKKLPHEIKENDNQISVNNIGIVTLR